MSEQNSSVVFMKINVFLLKADIENIKYYGKTIL